VVARRLWLAVPTSLLWALCAFGSPRARGRVVSDLGSARAAARSQPPLVLERPNSSTRTLRLQDSSWTQIQVEVRAGPNTTCDALGSLGVHVLQQGQEWAVQFDDPVICWRRTQSLGTAASSWAAWNQLKLVDGEVRIVVL
jgi:hypothetical protein